MPVPHATHAVEDRLSPSYCPAAHSVQAVSPALAAALPAAQVSQPVAGSESSSACPAGHAIQDCRSAAAYLPASHGTQV